MNVKRISSLAIFIALSAIGAFIKIPAIITTVALDSFPALIAAAILGPTAGAIVAGLGHIISALISGMPLGPLHFIIMLEMTLLVWAFGILYKTGKKGAAAFLFFIGNSFILPIPFIFIISWAFYMAMLPSLLLAAAINLIIAFILLPRLAPVLEKLFFHEEKSE
jgi:riboflavin transporter FmnP